MVSKIWQRGMKRSSAWLAAGMAMMWLMGTSWAQTPTALLSKLRRLEHSKRTHHQNTRRHGTLKQKYERMVRMHASEMKRCKDLHTKASKEVKQIYLALSRYHKGIATLYARMARSEQDKAKRDKRNAIAHLTKARRYQATSKKHAQTAYNYMRKSGTTTFTATLDKLRKQPLLRVPVKRPHLGTMPRLRPQILAPRKR